MKVFSIFGIVALLSLGIFAQETSNKSVDCGCDFSRYKPLKVSHFLTNAVVKEVEPEYPPAAAIVKASGKVVVKILVDRKGDVIETCIIEGHALLRATSLQAAKNWKFKRNFGFLSSKRKERYVEAELTFNFKQP